MLCCCCFQQQTGVLRVDAPLIRRARSCAAFACLVLKLERYLQQVCQAISRLVLRQHQLSTAPRPGAALYPWSCDVSVLVCQETLVQSHLFLAAYLLCR